MLSRKVFSLTALMTAKHLALVVIIVVALFAILSSAALSQIDRRRVSGRYIPELHGAHLGKYVHDDSGRYYHIHIPYDGGYGDRGLKYIHDERGNIVPRYQPDGKDGRPFALGPDDHIRFMVDFNYNGTGWQIVKFEWQRDGDDSYNYDYLNSNQLWNDDGNRKGPTPDFAYRRDEEAEDDGSGDGKVQVDGEYSEFEGINYSYKDQNRSKNTPKKSTLRRALLEVLDYIQIYIIPTL